MKNGSLIYAMNDVDPDVVRYAEPGARKKRNRARLKAAAFAMIAVVSAFAVGFAVKGGADNVAARVYLDVNPSFSLDVSRGGKITSVSAENEDAERLLSGGGALSDSKNVKIGDLLGLIMKGGYLSEDRNTMLLSVECDDMALAEELKKGLVAEAGEFLSDNLPGGHVLAQSLSENEKADRISKTYGISKGAAAFLIRLIGVNENCTEKELSSLDLTSLRLLCEENGISTEREVALSSIDAIDASERAMRERLGDEPESSTVFGYVDAGGSGCWRTEARGSKFIALYDIDAKTGGVVREIHAEPLDRSRLLDLAVAGSGHTSNEVAHYEIIKDDKWNWLYVSFPSPSGDELADFLKLETPVLDPLVLCAVRLHIIDEGFFTVSINAVTGEVMTVEKNNYTYSIDTLDAVIISMEDAGLPTDAPEYPRSCVIADGVCTVEFDYENNTYAYTLDAFTGKIISKNVG